MKISFEFEAGNKKEALFLGTVAHAMKAYANYTLDENSAIGKSKSYKKCDPATHPEAPVVEQQDATSPDAMSSEAPQQEAPDTQQEQHEEPTAEPATPHDEVPDADPNAMPFDDNDAHVTEGPKTMTTVEFRRILDEKRNELGIKVHTEQSVKLSNYLKTISEQYGSPVPSKLDPESLYRFVHNELVNIVYDEENEVFTQKAPF